MADKTKTQWQRDGTLVHGSVVKLIDAFDSLWSRYQYVTKAANLAGEMNQLRLAVEELRAALSAPALEPPTRPPAEALPIRSESHKPGCSCSACALQSAEWKHDEYGYPRLSTPRSSAPAPEPQGWGEIKRLVDDLRDQAFALGTLPLDGGGWSDEVVAARTALLRALRVSVSGAPGGVASWCPRCLGVVIGPHRDGRTCSTCGALLLSLDASPSAPGVSAGGEATARRCNRHHDCDEADRIVMAAEGRPASHCPGPNCGPICPPAPGDALGAPRSEEGTGEGTETP